MRRVAPSAVEIEVARLHRERCYWNATRQCGLEPTRLHPSPAPFISVAVAIFCRNFSSSLRGIRLLRLARLRRFRTGRRKFGCRYIESAHQRLDFFQRLSPLGRADGGRLSLQFGDLRLNLQVFGHTNSQRKQSKVLMVAEH